MKSQEQTTMNTTTETTTTTIPEHTEHYNVSTHYFLSNHLYYPLRNPCALLWLLLALKVLLTRARINMHAPFTFIGKAGRKLQCLKITLTLFLVYILWQPDTPESPRQADGSSNSNSKVNQLLDNTLSLDGLKNILLCEWSPVASYILVASLMVLEMFQVWKHMTIPLFLFWWTTLVSLLTTFLGKDAITDVDEHNRDIIHICVVVFQGFSFLLTKDETKKTKYLVHPKTQASWLSDVLLFWTFNLIWTGCERHLEVSDLPPLMQVDKCRTICGKFEMFWKIEKHKKMLDREKNEHENISENISKHNLKNTSKTKTDKMGIGDAPSGGVSLVKVLIDAFGVRVFILHFCKGVFELAPFVRYILTTQFMMYIQNRENEPWTKGVGIAITMAGFTCFKTVTNYRLLCAINRYQNRIRSSMILAIVKKSLTIKNGCTKDTTTGEIVNFISNDCNRITRMGTELYLLLSSPLAIITSMYLLYIQIGPAMYMGLFVMILFMPINHWIGKKLRHLHARFTQVKDSRTKIINEIINGIKALKLYAWEPSFISKVHDIRNEDVKINKSFSGVTAGNAGMFRAIPFFINFAVFGMYLLMGGHIDAVRGLSSMYLFYMLIASLGIMAINIPAFVEASIALKRINQFLNGENIPSDVVTHVYKGDSAVVINNGMFSWDPLETGGREVNLKNINVDIPKGGLVAVVGVVGAGKSSLLSAILGEMEKLEGEVEIQGSVAYVPQEAWMMRATVKENILFGAEKEPRRCKNVISACNLRVDVKNMAAGDQAIIGEKGVNLSGGQKQRLSLARAVYNDADIYLMDDPLSAVDAHVGKHIFQKVIGRHGLLKDKTRLLVTHGIHWLPFVDSIIVVKDGQISETGTYEELTSYNGDFAQFVRQVLSQVPEITTPLSVNKERQQIFNSLNSINEKIKSSEIQNKSPLFKEHVPRNEEHLQSRLIISEPSSDRDDNVDDDDDDTIGKDYEIDDKDSGDNRSNQSIDLDENNLEQHHGTKAVYIEYMRTIGYKLVAVCCLLYCTAVTFSFTNTYIVKQWTDDPLLANTSLSDSPVYSQTNWRYFGKFAMTGFLEVLFALVYVVVVCRVSFLAATRIHNKLLFRVLRYPMAFFNVTPSSRIVTLFSNDIPRVDGFGFLLRHLICRFFNVCTYLFMLIMYCPSICTILLPISVVLVLLFALHSGSLRELNRYKTNHRSPMYTHFSELYDGRVSIRAYNSEKRFVRLMEDKIDRFNNIELWENWVFLGLNMRFILTYRLVELVTLLICVLDTSMTTGMVCVVFLYAQRFCDSLTSFLRLAAKAELEIVSLERVIDYSSKPSEAPWEFEDKKPSNEWPSDGRVVFNRYKGRHQPDSELALKGINCCIERGQKVGIVGATGAGKTSLVISLFRLFEAEEGSISIDDVNIAEIGLHDLRSRINILPQEAVIFKGSLRMNLDPFGRNTDKELWLALQHAHLDTFVDKLTDKLDFECGEGGKNLSMGQRQLICLARTLLKKTKLLVLDEATAAVDMETDELIQKTIRSEFKDSTVLTIAHRLNTVMDYDRILVLHQGLVKEFDSPRRLLADKHSLFYSLAKDAKLVE